MRGGGIEGRRKGGGRGRTGNLTFHSWEAHSK